MLNFQVFNVKRIIFEKDAIFKLEKLIKNYKNPLLVIGKHLLKNKNYKDFFLNLNLQIFSEVEPEVSIQTLEKMHKLYKEKNLDVIIGIGGGSVLDAAKGLSAILDNDINAKKYLYKEVIPPLKRRVDLILAPTTSGTGSEVTGVAVFKDLNTLRKASFGSVSMYADIAIVDAKLTLSMNKELTINTALDALTHAIESHLSTKSNDYFKLFSAKAINIIFNNLINFKESDLNNYSFRENLAYASMLAGISFANTGLGFVHSICHPIGALYHLPHGFSCAIVLDKILKLYKEKGVKINEQWIKNLEIIYKKFDIKFENKLNKDNIEFIANETFVSRALKTAPYIPNKEEVKAFIENNLI